MPDPFDETRTLRRRLAGIEDDLASGGDDTRWCCSCLVGQTSSMTSYPTTASAYYALRPVRITGKVAEGVAPTMEVLDEEFLALNLGTTVPPLGEFVVATTTTGRWTFRYG